MSLENANTSTTLEAKTIKSLPNPGQDLTYVAQFAEGALMNTAGSSNDAKAAGGYGNVEFNGLPATSNGYILDGYDSNDPFLGLNIGLSTNLVIGLDALAGGDGEHQLLRGRSGPLRRVAGQLLHQIGTNQFHGDLYEIWNGSLFNATDYFLHANDTPGNIAKKPRSTVNEFGVSVGGPDPRRTSSSSSPTTKASASRCRWWRAPPSRRRPISSMCCSSCRWAAPIRSPAPRFPREPQEVPFYQSMFGALQQHRRHARAGALLPARCEWRAAARRAVRGNLFNGAAAPTSARSR